MVLDDKRLELLFGEHRSQLSFAENLNDISLRTQTFYKPEEIDSVYDHRGEKITYGEWKRRVANAYAQNDLQVPDDVLFLLA